MMKSMRKIICVCLNPAVDKNVFIDSFTVGTVNRVLSENIIKSAGGKGVNVAKVISLLSGDCERFGMPHADFVLTGFVAGLQGDYILDEMNHLGVEHDFVQVRGETRTSLNIVDRFNDEETEILEEGFTVKESRYKEFIKKIKGMLAEDKTVLVLSGGIPSGVPVSVYRDIIEIAKEYDTFIILDSSGEPYTLGLENGPDLIKPNIREIKQIYNPLPGEGTIEFAERLRRQNNITNIVVSAGAGVARLISDDGVVEIMPPKVKTVNSIGSGDSMVGGIAYAVAAGFPMNEAVCLGVACGASNATSSLVGMVDPAVVKELYDDMIGQL